MTGQANMLPLGFEDLEPFVGYWAGESTNTRLHARSGASMEDIRCFYDAIIDRAEAALTYLDPLPIDALPEEAARLFRLVLALAQAAVAVEIHGQPRAPGTPYPNSIRLVAGAQPFG